MGGTDGSQLGLQGGDEWNNQWQNEQRQRERAVVEARKRDHVNDRSYRLSMQAFDKVEKMLALPLIETVMETDKSGRPITIWKPAKWSYTTVCELTQLADRMLSKSLDSASEQYSSYFSGTAPEDDFED